MIGNCLTTDEQERYDEGHRDGQHHERTEGRKYNGWTNHETWCVNLWLGNDQGTYEYWRDAAGHHQDNDKAAWARDLADDLKEQIETEVTPEGASMASELIGSALAEVNWQEIAEGMIEGLLSTLATKAPRIPGKMKGD